MSGKLLPFSHSTHNDSDSNTRVESNIILLYVTVKQPQLDVPLVVIHYISESPAIVRERLSAYIYKT